MTKPQVIPELVFRIEPGFTFDQGLSGPELTKNNLLVGELRSGRGNNAFLMGKVAEFQHSRTKTWLDFEGAHAVYVVGKRRSGKTYTLGVLAEGLMSSSWVKQGSTNQAVLLVDSMNVFVTMPYLVAQTYSASQAPRQDLDRWQIPSESIPVVLYYPRGTNAPPEGNVRELSIKPSELVGEDWAALFEVDTYSDPMGQLIAELYEKVAVEGFSTRAAQVRSANSNYEVQDLLDCLDQCPDMDRYEQRTLEAIRRRLKSIERLPIFSSNGVDVQDIFQPGHISVLLVRDMDQQFRSLLVAIIVKKIMQLRSHADRFERLAAVHRSRRDLPQQESCVSPQEIDLHLQKCESEIESGLGRGWVIIDEAHNFLPARGVVPSSRPLKKFVDEGRNLGLSIVVATQNPSGLDPAIRRNADVLLIHSMSMRDDISATEGMVNTLIPDSYEVGGERITARSFEQLIRSLPPGYAVVSNDVVNRLFVMKVRPRVTVHGAIEY